VEQFNNTPENPILGRVGFGRVRRWIGPDGPDPALLDLSGGGIMILVESRTLPTSPRPDRFAQPIYMENKTKSLRNRIGYNHFGDVSAGSGNLRCRITACSTVFTPTAGTQDGSGLEGDA